LQPGEAVAVDGKTLRGIHGAQLPGVHLLAAYAHATGIVVGQQAVGDKENELAALPGLLEQLDLQGLVVTGDAQFTQRAVCREIVAKGGITSSR
jgi:diphthamide synthase (EF-2-diphthine--ammonia ligase)